MWNTQLLTCKVVRLSPCYQMIVTNGRWKYRVCSKILMWNRMGSSKTVIVVVFFLEIIVCNNHINVHDMSLSWAMYQCNNYRLMLSVFMFDIVSKTWVSEECLILFDFDHHPVLDFWRSKLFFFFFFFGSNPTACDLNQSSSMIYWLFSLLWRWISHKWSRSWDWILHTVWMWICKKEHGWTCVDVYENVTKYLPQGARVFDVDRKWTTRRRQS
jgi:hypothetical protein